MSGRKISLDVVGVVSPCHADWDQMQGDARKRFCDSCEKHVHNLSAMTREQAESFVTENPTGVCIQMSHDQHGRVITADCQTTIQPSETRRPALRPNRQRRRAAKAMIPCLTLVAVGAGSVLALLGMGSKEAADKRSLDAAIDPSPFSQAQGRHLPQPRNMNRLMGIPRPDPKLAEPVEIPMIMVGEIVLEQPVVQGLIAVPQPPAQPPVPEHEPEQPEQPAEEPAADPAEQVQLFHTRGDICIVPQVEKPAEPNVNE